ncbi:MAG: glycosyltransferase family 2 protein [Isosphaeraceae bacterium]
MSAGPMTLNQSPAQGNSNMSLDLSSTAVMDAFEYQSVNVRRATHAETNRPTRHSAAPRIAFSFVVPVKDEEATLGELYRRIKEQIRDDEPFEVIFIDDGSRDGSWGAIEDLVAAHPGIVRGLRFRRNCGKAAALMAGFRASRGEILFTLDADLQDDPKEIRRFLAKLDEGFDLLSGWKKVRHDPWHKVLPSRIFNRMLSRVTGVDLHDHNCGFKCYRAEVAKSLTLFGELHRMVPALAAIEGYRAAEIEVQHHPRKHGVSKYGFERYLRGFVDMLTVGFLRKYRERPTHFIGGVAAFALAGSLALLVLAISAGIYGLSTLALGSIAFSAALLGTATLSVICGLMVELTIRGGLRESWRLPIIEDTASNASPMARQFPAAAPVPVAYGLGA